MLLSENRLKYNIYTNYTVKRSLVDILIVAFRYTIRQPTKDSLEWGYTFCEWFTVLRKILLCFCIHKVLFLLFLGLLTTAIYTTRCIFVWVNYLHNNLTPRLIKKGRRYVLLIRLRLRIVNSICYLWLRTLWNSKIHIL